MVSLVNVEVPLLTHTPPPATLPPLPPLPPLLKASVGVVPPLPPAPPLPAKTILRFTSDPSRAKPPKVLLTTVNVELSPLKRPPPKPLPPMPPLPPLPPLDVVLEPPLPPRPPVTRLPASVSPDKLIEPVVGLVLLLNKPPPSALPPLPPLAP